MAASAGLLFVLATLVVPEEEQRECTKLSFPVWQLARTYPEYGIPDNGPVDGVPCPVSDRRPVDPVAALELLEPVVAALEPFFPGGLILPYRIAEDANGIVVLVSLVLDMPPETWLSTGSDLAFLALGSIGRVFGFLWG